MADTGRRSSSEGLALVPEGRRVFSRMTVRENLEMGAFMQNDKSPMPRAI